MPRVAVLDLGSNSFRLVVFGWDPGGAWRRTDEIYEPVRVSERMDATDPPRLQEAPMERALETLELFAHFCGHLDVADVRPVATSAIRDAANQAEFLEAARARAGLEVRVLSRAEEAYFGYLAAVNTTRLVDGVALDIGGGSLQLVRVGDRTAADSASWPLGAVRVTERFLAGDAGPDQVATLRDRVAAELAQAPWLAGAGRDGRLAGIGGAVRNLAAAAMHEHGLPGPNVQGFELTRGMLDSLVDRLAALEPGARGKVRGIKPERGDVILAGALVVQSVMEAGGFEALEVSEAGLREGVFFSTLLEASDAPLFEDVRAAGVRNLAAQYGADPVHAGHVAALALGVWDGLGDAGLHEADPTERELLWAAAMLHDIGVAVDYDDHHKHSRYLILNAGLPGHTPRETALIAQMARYHRKGTPSLGDLAPLARRGDDALLLRGAALLRLAEQLDRARDQQVRAARVDARGEAIRIFLDATGDAALARWSARRHLGVLERAFGRPVELA